MIHFPLAYFGVIIAPAILIFLACRRWNIAAASFVAACTAAILSGIPLQNAIFEVFASAFASFIRSWFLLFVVSAIFGFAMVASETAEAIAHLAFKYFGAHMALLATLLISLFLAYGGMSTFVIAFAMYPIAEVLFRKACLPRSLLPAALLFCPTTLAMTMLPGSPAIQNMLPTLYLGTTIYAAPWLGLAVATGVFFAGYIYLTRKSKTLPPDLQHMSPEKWLETPTLSEKHSTFIIVLPFICIWSIAWICLKMGLDSKNSVTIGLAAGALVCLTHKKTWIQARNIVDNGIKHGITALIMVSSVMGFGAVAKATPGYVFLTGFISDLSSSPLAGSAVLINIIAAVTGSSAASLEIFFSSHTGALLASGLNPEIIHRLLAIASSGLDSMPYASGIVLTLHLSSISLKDAYPHIFVTCAILPMLATGLILFWSAI